VLPFIFPQNVIILLISDNSFDSTLNLAFNLICSVLAGIIYLKLPDDQVNQGVLQCIHLNLELLVVYFIDQHCQLLSLRDPLISKFPFCLPLQCLFVLHHIDVPSLALSFRVFLPFLVQGLLIESFELTLAY
jgi:hypothetical protein